MRVHGESQALPVLEEARLTDTQGSAFGAAEKEKV